MIKDNIEQLSGNDRYEGYNIDLIDAIAKELKFNYTIQIVADSQYGKKLDNGTWNGMIGELLSQVRSEQKKVHNPKICLSVKSQQFLSCLYETYLTYE